MLSLSLAQTCYFPCGHRRRRLRLPPAHALASGEEETQLSKLTSLSDFFRFRRVGGETDGRAANAGELQSAVVSYRKRFPWRLLNPLLQVDLVSTIHIADKEYFDKLQKGLEDYDCVLYEMVTNRENLEKSKNSTSRKLKKSHSRRSGFSVIGSIQKLMAQTLSLNFQLDCLDYGGDNWLHADLDIESFQKLQEERKESFFTFARDLTLKSTEALTQPVIPEGLDFWRSKLLWASYVLPMPLLGSVIITQICTPIVKQAEEYPELEAFSRLDFGAGMKFILAREMTSEQFMGMSALMEKKSVIIGERNRVAVEEIKRAIDNGHKRIAVLYGGGHMPDLGRRLEEELAMMPSQVEWITAWSIRNRNIDSNSLPFLKKLAEISGWPLNRYQTFALLIFSSVLALDLWFWELFVTSVVDWASWF